VFVRVHVVSICDPQCSLLCQDPKPGDRVVYAIFFEIVKIDD